MRRTAIYSNLTPESVALNNRHCLRWDCPLPPSPLPFNNGLLSNELVLSVRDGPGRAGILPPVSRRCCDSKELEINLGYNNFFCGPRPTTHINQISSFRASALAPRSYLHSPIVVPDSVHLCSPGCHPRPTFRQCQVPSFFHSFSRSNIFLERSLCAYLTTMRVVRLRVLLSKIDRESIYSQRFILDHYLFKMLKFRI